MHIAILELGVRFCVLLCVMLVVFLCVMLVVFLCVMLVVFLAIHGFFRFGNRSSCGSGSCGRGSGRRVSSFVSCIHDTGKGGQGNSGSDGQGFKHFNFP